MLDVIENEDTLDDERKYLNQSQNASNMVYPSSGNIGCRKNYRMKW